MELLKQFIYNFDAEMLLLLVLSLLASMLCIMVHELSHALAALSLGDSTAKRLGRLSLNPLSHIDPIGFLMLVVARVGWAKPVPIDIRSFRHPKRDMALTAFAGPLSNFLLAIAAVFAAGIIHANAHGIIWAYVVYFLCYVCVLSVGLGLFNLIPIPPLDGSKLLFSLLPERLYNGYLCYERYLLVVVVALAWFGVFSGPLGTGISWTIRAICDVFDFPFEYFSYYFGL